MKAVVCAGESKKWKKSKQYCSITQRHGPLQNTNFPTRSRVKVLLKRRMRAEQTIYPALPPKSSDPRSMRWLSFIPARLAFTHIQAKLHAYRYVWWSPLWQNCIAVSTGKGRSPATPSRDFSEAAHPSSALLSCTVQMEQAGEKRKRKKVMKTPLCKQNRGPPPGRPDPHENLQTTVVSLPLLFFLNQQKLSDRGKMGSKRQSTTGDPR